MKFIFSFCIGIFYSHSLWGVDVPIIIMGTDHNKHDTTYLKELLIEKGSIPAQLIAIETMVVSNCKSPLEERAGVILELCLDDKENLVLRHWNKEKWEKTMKVFSQANN